MGRCSILVTLSLCYTLSLHAAETPPEAQLADVTPENTPKPSIFFVIGPPGSGQGILAVKVAKTFSLPLLSPAKLLVEEIKEKSDLAKKAQDYLNQQRAIPESLLLEILCKRIMKGDECKNGFLLDGIPNTVEQAIKLKEKISSRYSFNAISIKVPTATLIKRAEGRRVCKQCGTVCHKTLTQTGAQNLPQLCDNCDATVVQLASDTPENVMKELEEYRQEMSPILTFFQNEKMLTEVSGDCSLELTLQEIKDKVKRKG